MTEADEEYKIAAQNVVDEWNAEDMEDIGDE